MENRLSVFYDDHQGRDEGPQPIGEILSELLARYEARFLEARIVVVETPIAAG